MGLSHLLDRGRALLFICRDAIRFGYVPGLENNDVARGRARYVRVARTAMTSGLNTILATAVSVFSVALTVRYLGAERFGLWLTISTILAWLNLSDFGIGNALTNRISAAYGQGRNQDARHIIATAFWLFFIIGLLIMIIGVVLSMTLPWARLFRAQSALAAQELPLAFALSFVIYGMGFPLGITKSVYSGYQEGYYSNFWSIMASLASLLAIAIVIQSEGGLPLLVVAVFGARLLVLVASTVFLFGFHRSALTLAPRVARRTDVRSLSNLGFMFVVLQFVGLLVTQTDNLVIVRMLGPESVAVYGTAWKLFNYIGVLQMWILIPLWPAYGEAYSRGDINWIRRTLKFSLYGILASTVLLSGALLFSARGIIRLWVGPELVPRFGLILGLSMMWVLWGWTQPFVLFLNGISRLRGQILYGLSTGFLGLALKIVLVPHWGLEGVIGATLLSYILIAAWILPLDALKGLKSIPGAG